MCDQPTIRVLCIHGLRLKRLKDFVRARWKVVFFQAVVLAFSPDVGHQDSGLPDPDLFVILLIN